VASTDIATTSPRAVPRPVAVIGTAGTATSRVCCCRFVLQCATGAERGDTRCLSNAFRRSARKAPGMAIHNSLQKMRRSATRRNPRVRFGDRGRCHRGGADAPATD